MKPVARLLLALLLLAPVTGLTGNPAGATTARTDLQPIGFSAWETVLEDLGDSIVVVDYWASWCPPCIERFPHMVEMHREYASRGVKFISLNLDEQGDAESLEWCDEFLAQTGAVFPNYHMDENMSSAFEHLDLLGLPTVRIYAPGGEVAYKLTGDNPFKQFTEKDVENAILELLDR